MQPPRPAVRLGLALRARRERGERPLTREQVAAALGYSVDRVKQVEHGTKPPGIAFMSRWVEVYGDLDDELRALWNDVRGPHVTDDPRIPVLAGAGFGDDADPAILNALLPAEVLAALEAIGMPDLQRRYVLSLLASAVGATGLSVVTEPWDRLARAVRRPARIDAATVAGLDARTVAFHELDRIMPSRVFHGDLHAHLDLLTTLLEGTLSAPLRREVTRIAGEAALLAGWLSIGLGRHDADRLYRVATDAARAAGDDALLAGTLGYRSYALSGGGDAQGAARMLDAATERLPAKGYPTARAWLTGRQAEEHAKLGEVTTARRLLDQARSDFEGAGQGPERGWISFLEAPRFRSLELQTVVNLGARDEITTVADGVLAALPTADRVPSSKAQATALADVAGAYLAMGDVEAATDYASSSLGHARKVEASFALSKLGEFRVSLERHATAAPARAFVERYDAAVAG